jgi:ATP-dependent helicase HrpA
MTDQTASIDQLLKNLDQAMISDRHRLRRQLHELRKRPDEAKLGQWVEKVQASFARVNARRMSVPTVRYDDSLRC